MGAIISTLRDRPLSLAFIVAFVVLYYRRKTTLRAGVDVEAEYKSTKTYYPGTIKKVNEDGTVDVAFDDGDNLGGVDASRVRILNPVVPAAVRGPFLGLTGFLVGDLVDSVYGGKDGKTKSFPGIVSARAGGDSYTITYNDGDVEEGVAARYLSLRRPREKKSYYSKGQGAAYLRKLKDESALHHYWLKCSHDAILEDMELLLDDGVVCNLKDAEITGKAKASDACKKMLQFTKGHLRLTGREAIDTRQLGDGVVLTQVKFKAIMGITVGDQVKWKNRKIIYFRRTRNIDW